MLQPEYCQITATQIPLHEIWLKCSTDPRVEILRDPDADEQPECMLEITDNGPHGDGLQLSAYFRERGVDDEPIFVILLHAESARTLHSVLGCIIKLREQYPKD